MEIYWTRDAAKAVPRGMSACSPIVETSYRNRSAGDAPSMRNHRIARFSAGLSPRSYRVSHAAQDHDHTAAPPACVIESWRSGCISGRGKYQAAERSDRLGFLGVANEGPSADP
jgi:hypothetical protein